MTHRVIRVALMAFVACAATAALADEVSWTYVEAGYLNVDPDNFSGSGDNVYGAGSIQLFKQFHIAGRYVDGDYADNVEQTTWDFAAGWHGLLGKRADLFAEATWTDTEIDNVGDSGIGVNAGVRFRPVGFFEADGIVKWTDYSDAGSDDRYELRAIFYVWRLGIGASATIADDDKRYAAFLRFAFSGE